ncbi:hypothetical protein [Pseudactinotalea suaedae]|uniref:hypothetical protein n=1 Tax=Pseudactinotalea suaedae TaxID=1524924 RepID=UPI0012E31735|nr:hypothetical protein [Pseudactinotalea suaedae]
MNRVAVGLLAAAVTAGTAAVLRSRPPAGPARWKRTNFRGREVDLLGGVAAAGGAVAGAVSAGGAAGAGAALVAATGGVLGAIDDADTTSASKGLRGHLAALRDGEVTTGLLKLVGISTSALAAAGIATGFGRRGGSAGSVPARAADVAASGVLIAGTANLVNLFDLRPGRALKLVGLVCAPLTAVPGATGRVAAAGLGTLAAAWESDLAEETMLGDAGANALGAIAGTALALAPVARVRYVATGVVVALVLLSEKISFSRVIGATGWLRAIDDWQRAE